ncbi:Uncharacterised protein [Mycobacteroides abscessus subsp. abscessus]|nr:Uncharacterised protein [Mycobacteroides abscessus subsp. abscessus]
MRAPLSGNTSAYSRRSAIRPGISCSARRISLRPNSASERSATLYSMPLRTSATSSVIATSIKSLKHVNSADTHGSVTRLARESDG